MGARRASVLFLASLLVLLACNTATNGPPPLADVVYSDGAYCDVARLPGLIDWNGGVATACSSLTMDPLDPDAVDGSSCTVWTADGAGNLVETSISGARAAMGVGDGAIVVWGWDGTLTVHERDGMTRELAPVAADPWVDFDDGSVAFIAPLPGASTLEPGDDRRVMRVELRSGLEPTELVTDATAAAPVPIPGSSDVLYVSTVGGVAQIVRVGPEDIVPLTNLDMTDVGMGFVPVYGRELVFVDGGARLVYASEFSSDSIWSVDLMTGEAERLGPGRYPALAGDGSVLAQIGSATDASCAVHYLDGSTP